MPQRLPDLDSKPDISAAENDGADVFSRIVIGPPFGVIRHRTPPYGRLTSDSPGLFKDDNISPSLGEDR